VPIDEWLWRREDTQSLTIPLEYLPTLGSSQACPGTEALSGLTFISYRTRGNKMQSSKQSKLKPTIKSTNKTTKLRPTDYEILTPTVDPFIRRGSVTRSPPPGSTTGGSAESIPSTSTNCQLQTKTIRRMDVSREGTTILKSASTREHKPYKPTTSNKDYPEDAPLDSAESISSDDGKSDSNQSETQSHENEKLTLEFIRNERTQLEEFLFNESNKINKNAIKFILAKWSVLEGKLQEEILETEKLRATHLSTQLTLKSYAQAVSLNSPQPTLNAPVTEIRALDKPQSEVILIKPSNEKDKRDNEEIKTAVLKHLHKVRHKVKMIKIRQLRQKGLAIEVSGKDDAKLISDTDMDKIGLKIEEPKKLTPTFVIYDVEETYKKEELKEDLIKKNFDNFSARDQAELFDKITFVKSFNTKNNCVNWIVQIPGRFMKNLLPKGKIYMAWRIYRIREFLNVVRCFKCQGYGHTAKVCSSLEQLCELCGKHDHSKKECPHKESPICVNCVRSRRKDLQHSVRSKTCPEYVKHVEIYRSKVKWI